MNNEKHTNLIPYNSNFVLLFSTLGTPSNPAPDRGGFRSAHSSLLYAPVSHDSQTRFPAKLNNILYYAAVIEMVKPKKYII